MPPLHPAVVHFPIALLSLAAALRLWVALSPREWLEATARLCLWLGSMTLAAAVLTGQATTPHPLPPAAAEIFRWHQQLGFTTLLWYGGLSLWEIRHVTSITMGRRRALAAAHIVGSLLLLSTAFFGGRLVYEFGVGTPTTGLR